MVQPLPSKRVLVQRAQDDVPFEATVICQIFQDLPRTDGQGIAPGKLFGFGIRDDRGFEMCAQESQMQPLVP